jgi:Transcriptional regulator
MDVQQLRYFIEVAKQKSFTKATDNLHLSQPALSKMIRNLEDELSVKLFDRNHKRIELTDCGENLLESAQKALLHFDSIVESLQDTMNLKKGHIIVGIPPVIGTTYFASIIASFKKSYPGVDLSIYEEGAKTVATQVMEGNVDVGVIISPVDSEELTAIPVMKDENVVVVNKKNPLADKKHAGFRDLKNESFCIFNEHFLLYGQIVSKCRKAGFEPDITFKSSQWDFIMEMLSLNQGISILPKPIATKLEYPNIKIIPLHPAFPWEITLIVRKGKYVSYAMREFINHVKNSFDEKNIN